MSTSLSTRAAMRWTVSISRCCSGQTATCTSARIPSISVVMLALAIWFDDTDRWARRTFAFSIVYLFALFATMLAGGTLGPVAA